MVQRVKQEAKTIVKYRFRLAGVAPDQAEREIDIGPDETVGDIKEKVRNAFHLQSDLTIELIVTPIEEENAGEDPDSESPDSDN
ncbi:MAG TPA: hypothetical protein VKK79_09400 [Candidatus Lokiarchaeia archaeon]|nr:hypothetical protein [Candidatus Lokiarchaeia archaeon]